MSQAGAAVRCRGGPSVAETLALVQLQEKQDAFVKTLSGGQKQRLSLACALRAGLSAAARAAGRSS